MGRNAVGQTDLAVIDGLSRPQSQSTAAVVSLFAGFPGRLLLCTLNRHINLLRLRLFLIQTLSLIELGVTPRQCPLRLGP